MYHRGYLEGQSCFGYGQFTMWHGLILLGIVILVAAFIWLINKKGKIHSDRVLDILKEKYAMGEINDEEYQRKYEILTRK